MLLLLLYWWNACDEAKQREREGGETRLCGEHFPTVSPWQASRARQEKHKFAVPLLYFSRLIRLMRETCRVVRVRLGERFLLLVIWWNGERRENIPYFLSCLFSSSDWMNIQSEIFYFFCSVSRDCCFQRPLSHWRKSPLSSLQLPSANNRLKIVKVWRRHAVVRRNFFTWWSCMFWTCFFYVVWHALLSLLITREENDIAFGYDILLVKITRVFRRLKPWHLWKSRKVY